MSEARSFAELLEESYVEPTRLEPGQKVEAVIVRIGREWIFINLGGKSEGYFAISEVTAADGGLTVKEGDSIEAYFLSSGKGGMLFTTRLGKGSEASAHLEEAFHGGIPVEGTIEKEVKGGFNVKVAGGIRAFCPFSQTGLSRSENEAAVGRKLLFVIMEYKEAGKNIIVSHRAVLEEERRQQREKLKASLVEGMTVSGTVCSIRNFGAFVDIGGLEGLLPISEICWGRIEDIHERLHEGQQIEVKIMKLDWDNDRFSFSLKNATPDPWETVAEKYPENSTQQGVVSRLTTFGAFVTLGEGVDGLLHISVLAKGRRINHPREVVTEGQNIEVRIEAINQEERRISLSPAEELAPRRQTAQAGTDPDAEEEKQRQDYQEYMGKAEAKKKSESLGTLGDLLASRLNKGK